MGHLLMPGPVGDFRKGVVSVWFRIPSATVAAARSKPYDTGTPWVMNFGLIPLLTWGEQIIIPGAGDVPSPMPPSHIGVRVGSSDFDWGQETLEVRLQVPDYTTGSGDHWSNGGEPDHFGNSADGQGFAGYPTVLIDHWNHLILSWDVSAGSSVSGGIGGTSKMWCSINDQNKSGADLPAMGPNDGTGANDHLSYQVIRFLGDPDSSADLGVTEISSVSFAVPSRVVGYIPTSGAGASTKNPILRVEMAELQVFAGVTLDTSDTAKRRKFVSADGLPVSPNAVDEDGNPVGSIGALGKQPEILLLGASDWSAGYNSGSLGIKRDASGTPILDDEGNPIRNPDGQFTPTGQILSWEPDPSLQGPQSRTAPPGLRLIRKPAAVS